MSEHSVAVGDTNVVLNLATPIVDRRPQAPSGSDSLKALLTAYDIHVPESVLDEVMEIGTLPKGFSSTEVSNLGVFKLLQSR